MKVAAVALITGCAINVQPAFSQGKESRMYGAGSPFGVDDLPPGQLRSAFESLPPQARARARNWLESFAYPEEDLEHIHLNANIHFTKES